VPTTTCLGQGASEVEKGRNRKDRISVTENSEPTAACGCVSDSLVSAGKMFQWRTRPLRYSIGLRITHDPIKRDHHHAKISRNIESGEMTEIFFVHPSNREVIATGLHDVVS